MKIEKENIKVLLLYGLVAYAIALLFYCSFKAFGDLDADNISAFGSILSATGTFYAAYVAIHLFNDWRDQAGFELKKEHANQLMQLLSISYDELHKISEIMMNLERIRTHEVLDEKYSIFQANELRDDFYKNQLPAKMLDRLNKKNVDIFLSFSKYQTHFIFLVESFNAMQKTYTIYLNAQITTMNNAQKAIYQNNNNRDIYQSTLNTKTREKKSLEYQVFRPINFYGNDTTYSYKDLLTMTDEMSTLYKILENKVLDSIDLKKM